MAVSARRRRGLAGIALAACLILAGCGGDEKGAATTTTTLAVTTTTTDPEPLIRRYSSVVAEHAPDLRANVSRCYDVTCAASAGAAYREIVDGFDSLPAPPDEIAPLVKRVLDGFDGVQGAAEALSSCMGEHKGENLTVACLGEIRDLTGLLAEQSDQLRAWDPYL